jgi:hypothetical protein
MWMEHPAQEILTAVKDFSAIIIAPGVIGWFLVRNSQSDRSDDEKRDRYVLLMTVVTGLFVFFFLTTEASNFLAVASEHVYWGICGGALLAAGVGLVVWQIRLKSRSEEYPAGILDADANDEPEPARKTTVYFWIPWGLGLALFVARLAQIAMQEK